MIDQTSFGAGLGVIALQLNKPITPAVIKAYHAAFEDGTDRAEWAAFCRVAAVRFGWSFLPTVTDLRDALDTFRGAMPVKREATEAYDAVIAAGEYTAERGTVWHYRGVQARCGRAAAQAFLEAGGHAAFAWGGRDEPARRERFIAAYVVEARQAPADRLLPAAPMLALPPGAAASDPRITRDEAVGFVERLRKLLGIEPSKPKARLVEATSERMDYLRRQAAEIGGADARAVDDRGEGIRRAGHVRPEVDPARDGARGGSGPDDGAARGDAVGEER